MSYLWLPLLPPLLVIILTGITRNVLLSLAGGVISAAAIATNFNPLATVNLAFQRILQETNLLALVNGGSLDHFYTFSFLLMLGALIQLMNHSGGMRAYTHFLLTFIKTSRAAQQTSLILSSTLFIDDYVNNLTVGAIMRPVTDHFKIARTKLAFLLDSMSGPMCMLLPASSWVAFILAQMQASGITLQGETGSLINDDPFFIYCASIPFLFYPLLIVSVAWLTVYYGFSYGSMARFETIAQQTGNLYGGNAELHPTNPVNHEQLRGTLIDFILPIITFISSFVIGILYSGKSSFLGGAAPFIQTLQQADPFWSLFMASVSALSFSIALFIYHNPLKMHAIVQAFFDGLMLMKNSLLVLLLAWTLSTLLKNDLQTGAYLASLLPAGLSVSFLPCIIFILCALISASIGSVWGTIALMLPITIPLYYTLAGASPTFLQTLYPLLGGLFSGAVAGSHFSPISDAMIMTSFSAGCYHLDHVRTQMSYALNALMGSLAGFAIIGIIPPTYSYQLTLGISLLTAFGVTVSLLLIRVTLNNKR
jgi:Na+/H+ antiporter NhaC